MDLHLWLAFVAASVALLLIPGPTILLILGYAISQGRRVALATVAGVTLGDFLALTASLLGLGALVATSATLFTVLKWVGAVYLVYLGVQLWRSAGKMPMDPLNPPETLPARKVFAHATLVTALNPKSIAFFIAFVPQFLRPAEPLAPQFVILIATFVGLAGLNTLVWALLADRLRARIGRPQIIARLSKLGGAALVGMGVMTAALRRG
ncbi:MAG: LysE family translocator [Pararhodobacter sp.]